MLANQTTAVPLRALARMLPLLALACGAPEPPNLVLVSIDTLRADAVGAYGGPVATPALDGLADEGILFEQAIAPASQTAPSHASLFTGREVLHHGSLRNGVPLADAAETLAEVVRSRGYSTAAFASSFVLDGRFGWAQGFDVYDDEFPKRGESMRHRGGIWAQYEFDGFDRNAAATNSRTLAWLASAREPFFLFVHYFDAHAPYTAPPKLLAQVPRPFALRAADERIAGMRPFMPRLGRDQLEAIVRNYQAEVLQIDRAVGGLLAAIDDRGLRGRTLVVLTADHGEGLGQHGTLDHAPNVYEEQVHIPLILRWPGHLDAGRRIREPVGLVDVAPTIAELLGTAFTQAIDGRSLTDAMESGSVQDPLPIIGRRRRYERAFRGHRGVKFFVRDGHWKYIAATEDPDELYDLTVDPMELRNLYDAEPEEAARLRRHLDATLARHPDRDVEIVPDAELRRGLEALGYTE